MLHISPCGWYSFEINTHDLTLEDTREKTEIRPHDTSYTLEIVSARKDNVVDDDEMLEIHEEFLITEKIKPSKTILSQNSFEVKYYITRGLTGDNGISVVSHMYWDRYCIFLQFLGDADKYYAKMPEVIYNILESVQPLTTG